MSVSMPARPSLRALLNSPYIIFSVSMYCCLLFLGPFKTCIRPAKILFNTYRGLPDRRMPSAAPAMMRNSEGCNRTSSGPFSIRNPPNTAPNTITIPMMANMRDLPFCSSQFPCNLARLR